MFAEQLYEAIAGIIESEYTSFDNTPEDDTEGKLTCKAIANKLASYFETDNPNFDYNKFMKACGIDE